MNVLLTMEAAIRFAKIVMEAINANATLDSSFQTTIVPAKVRFLYSPESKLRLTVNRPFYSRVLSYLAMNGNEAEVDLALIQTSLLFSCKCKLVSIIKLSCLVKKNLICIIKAVRSVSKQGHLQPRCHSEARSLSRHRKMVYCM